MREAVSKISELIMASISLSLLGSDMSLESRLRRESRL